MEETHEQQPFSIPAFRSFVPRRLQPWLYILMACTFQLSAGMYIGALSPMVGETAFLREDMLMCLYCNLAGMALYFPLLFRMKFRFTNKTLLTAAAIGVLVCNIATMYVRFLPLLWLLCFVEGCCKIQGTFECMSTIQLWMTPKRDFTIFFPLLHIIILNAVQVNKYIAAFFAEHLHWTSTHWLIIGLMLCNLLLLTCCTRHVHLGKPMSLSDIDWLGGLLWAVLFVQLIYLFNYADHYNWFDGSPIRILSLTSVLTLVVCLWRMCIVPHPYIARAMWRFHPRYFHLLILAAILEVLLGSESVLEEVFYGSGLHLGEWTTARLSWVSVAGITCGCLFCYAWMHRWKQSFFRLITIGVAFIVLYFVSFYLLISTDLPLRRMYLPVFCRSVASAITGVTMMVALHDMMNFELFFQALSIFQAIHMFMGGVWGSALYSTAMRYAMNDNISRYGYLLDSAVVLTANGTGTTTLPTHSFGEYVGLYMEQMQMISVKQILGWLVIATLFLFLVLLSHDMPARRELHPFPTWETVRQRLLRRQSKPQITGSPG